MGRSCILTLAVLLIVQFGHATPQADFENNTIKLDGTWELISYKYGSTAPYSAMPKDRREIKLTVLILSGPQRARCGGISVAQPAREGVGESP